MADPPSYLWVDEVLQLHSWVIRRYGGMPGVRDMGALDSSLAQPRMVAFGVERFPSLYDKAAAYCFFIVRNHPFFDGNKRAGFLAALHFLSKNGVAPSRDEDSLYRAISGVADGSVGIEALVKALQS